MQNSRIIICGDFRAAHPDKIQLSAELKDIFKQADYKVCNFEAPIHANLVKRIKKSGPLLEQSANSPAKVKELGFNVILMANNHIMDNGEDGLQATLNSFKDVVVVGAGKAEKAFSVKYVETAGYKIGLLSLVQREFGVLNGKDDKGVGSAWINSLDVPGIIQHAAIQCDFLIVFPHAGVEFTAAPLPEWRGLYHRFIDWGAAAVVASHPHCPQGWENYKGKPIYYSLGNFYFDELTSNDLWYKSIVVELVLGETVEAKEYYVHFDDKTGIIDLEHGERMSDYIEYANHLLRNDDEYTDYIDSMCSKHWPGIKYGLLRGVGGVSFKLHFKLILRLLGCMLLGNIDQMFLLNVFQCESHRWVAERFLRINNGIKV